MRTYQLLALLALLVGLSSCSASKVALVEGDYLVIDYREAFSMASLIDHYCPAGHGVDIDFDWKTDKHRISDLTPAQIARIEKALRNHTQYLVARCDR